MMVPIGRREGGMVFFLSVSGLSLSPCVSVCVCVCVHKGGCSRGHDDDGGIEWNHAS